MTFTFDDVTVRQPRTGCRLATYRTDGSQLPAAKNKETIYYNYSVVFFLSLHRNGTLLSVSQMCVLVCVMVLLRPVDSSR